MSVPPSEKNITDHRADAAQNHLGVHQRLRGTAALQVASDQRCHGRLPLLADSLEGYALS
jgi:hypothetical protein